jgi:flagellar L-ring protein precursor FlgH
MRPMLVLVAVLALAPVAAAADTLYQAAPPPSGPGHPFSLMNDHRASQIGDLVYVQFDFANTNSEVNDYSSNKQSSVSGGNGAGLFNLPLVRLNSSVAGTSTTSTTQTATGANAFTATMTATVTGLLPSGALQISGDQALTVNGQLQTLHITGTVRVEDINNLDTVLASRVANVQAVFKGNDQKNKGLLARVMSWLF